MAKISIILLFSFFFKETFSQINIAKDSSYQKASEEIINMLNGKMPVDFKRAVFLVENAYHNDSLSYQNFNNQLNEITAKLEELIKKNGFEKYKTAGNWAAFTYMIDSLPENNYTPFTYDFEDFMGDEDWTKMFTTKLLYTKKGNCHSFPILYKIFAEELGAEANLALAPNHIYIKHKDETGKWANLELTNGSFSRDAWIISSMGITSDAIKNEIYMHPLNEKQSIAFCLFDLASGYEFKYGYDDFVLACADTALKYFPNFINALMLKAQCIQAKIETKLLLWGKKTPETERLYSAYKEINAKIDSLGYQDMPPELYEEWVKSVENEKIKREVNKN